MNRRKMWVLILVLGLLFLAVGAVVVIRDVTRYRSSAREALRTSCLRQVIVFEEFAERWIIRDQLDSLTASAKLLLMGSGLYVDVMVQGTILYSDHDEGLAMEMLPSSIEPDALIAKAESRDLPFGAIEVTVPIVLTGYPDSSIGVIRMAFSGNHTNSEVRGHALRIAGIGVAAWLGMTVGLVIVGWRARRRIHSIDSSILQSGTLRIELNACEVHLEGQAIDLTPKLYDLLLLFARQPGVLLTDHDILTEIWSDSAYAASADVKQCIYMLRRKLLEAHPDPKQIIVTLKGFGYRFDPPANEDRLIAS